MGLLSLFFCFCLSLSDFSEAYGVDEVTIYTDEFSFDYDFEDASSETSRFWRVMTGMPFGDPHPRSIEQYKKIRTMDRLLLLADGFDVFSDGVFGRLTEVYSEESPTIIRSGLECPRDLRTATPTGQITIHRRLNNNRPFPFEEGFFDLILMRRGLCFCDPDQVETSCGGLDLEGELSERFFSEVCRTLKTSNPDAVAILHGLNLYARMLGSEVFKRGERRVEFLRRTLTQLEVLRPELKISLVFGKIPLANLVRSGCRVDELNTETGAPAAELVKQADEQGTRLGDITVLEGVLIQVRSIGSSLEKDMMH
jgi:hypothetical protein